MIHGTCESLLLAPGIAGKNGNTKNVDYSTTSERLELKNECVLQVQTDC